jgi:hypothetical protein
MFPSTVPGMKLVRPGTSDVLHGELLVRDRQRARVLQITGGATRSDVDRGRLEATREPSCGGVMLEQQRRVGKMLRDDGKCCPTHA